MKTSSGTSCDCPNDLSLEWPQMRFPDNCRGVDVVVGIDEAGRGPVLGSLVYCAAFWPVSENESICKMGFDDSKQLKDSQREQYLRDIMAHPSIGYVLSNITAQEIAEQMLKASPKSLNSLSYDTVIHILESIHDISPDPPSVRHLYVDTVGDPGFYRSKIIEAMGSHFADNITVEKKADATYKVVGAASIIAKQTRDILLDRHQYDKGMTLDKNYGSGYPSDERCVQWMVRSHNKIFGYPVDFVRLSWSTARVSMKEHGATTVDWPCDEVESMGGDISSFFGVQTQEQTSPVSKRRRSDYFHTRRMKHVNAAFLCDESS